jgi:hypothetical protein
MSIIDKILFTEAVIAAFCYLLVITVGTEEKIGRKIVTTAAFTTLLGGLLMVITFIVKIWV